MSSGKVSVVVCHVEGAVGVGVQNLGQSSFENDPEQMPPLPLSSSKAAEAVLAAR